jgi:alcohol dehydrogenase class IV
MIMKTTWEYNSSPRIVFGTGSLRQIGEIAASFRAKHVLLVTDRGLVQAGMVGRALAYLDGFDVRVYDRVVPEPPVEAALDCLAFAQSGPPVDLVIGLGGGSCLDMAKVVALLITHGGHPLDYAGECKVPGPVVPIAAIPTTAGTGSEATSVAVITDAARNLKVGISDNYLRPAVALVDPELTVGLPPYITACSGIDALSHAIEAYTAMPSCRIQAEGNVLFQGSMPISDMLAWRAIELISQNLAVAVRQGSNLEARSNMMLGSLLAGMAFSNAGTAAAHALSYPIGGRVKSPHGELTGLLLPYVMEMNADTQPEKMIRIAQAFGIHASEGPPEEAPLAAARAVMNLLRDIGLPTRLSQIGIKAEDLPAIAEEAVKIERLIRNNPKRVTARDFEALLNKAL